MVRPYKMSKRMGRGLEQVSDHSGRLFFSSIFFLFDKITVQASFCMLQRAIEEF